MCQHVTTFITHKSINQSTFYWGKKCLQLGPERELYKGPSWSGVDVFTLYKGKKNNKKQNNLQYVTYRSKVTYKVWQLQQNLDGKYIYNNRFYYLFLLQAKQLTSLHSHDSYSWSKCVFTWFINVFLLFTIVDLIFAGSGFQILGRVW